MVLESARVHHQEMINQPAQMSFHVLPGRVWETCFFPSDAEHEKKSTHKSLTRRYQPARTLILEESPRRRNNNVPDGEWGSRCYERQLQTEAAPQQRVSHSSIICKSWQNICNVCDEQTRFLKCNFSHRFFFSIFFVVATG